MHDTCIVAIYRYLSEQKRLGVRKRGQRLYLAMIRIPGDKRNTPRRTYSQQGILQDPLLSFKTLVYGP